MILLYRFPGHSGSSVGFRINSWSQSVGFQQSLFPGEECLHVKGAVCTLGADVTAAVLWRHLVISAAAVA